MSEQKETQVAGQVSVISKQVRWFILEANVDEWLKTAMEDGKAVISR